MGISQSTADAAAASRRARLEMLLMDTSARGSGSQIFCRRKLVETGTVRPQRIRKDGFDGLLLRLPMHSEDPQQGPGESFSGIVAMALAFMVISLCALAIIGHQDLISAGQTLVSNVVRAVGL